MNIRENINNFVGEEMIHINATNKPIPLWEKYTLTIQEAAEYFYIGEKKLRRLVEDDTEADYIIMNGNRVMIKRKLFEKFIDEASIV